MNPLTQLGAALGMPRSLVRLGIRGFWPWLAGTVALVSVALLIPVSRSALAAVPSAADADGKPARGFYYLHDKDPSVPWSMHVIKVRRGHPDFQLHTTLGRGTAFGMACVSDQLRTVPSELGAPVGAVNGDFYRDNEHYQGRPRDLQILRGELVSAASGNAVFWLDPDGTPHLTNLISRLRVVWPDGSGTALGLNEERLPDQAVLYTPAVGASTHASGGVDYILEKSDREPWLPLAAGRTHHARVREIRASADSPIAPGMMVISIGSKLVPSVPPISPGMVVQVVTDTFPSLTGVQTAIGGGPTLVRNGKAQKWGGFQMRHPRSAVGFNREFIFLVEVDGRQGGLSLGMSLPELAAYMVKLGCDEAMNLDGGGSATLWVFGNVINSPSEGRERPAANALVVVEKPKKARRE